MRKLLSAFSLLTALALAPLTAWGQAACPIGNQAPVSKASNYAIQAADICSMLVFSTASSAPTLPNANTTPSGWVVTIKNASSNALTVTPSVSTIDGGTSLTVNAGASVEIRSNNVNYFSAAGGAGGAYQSGTNIIQNGDFLIDQQYAGASQTVQTSSTRSLDRWFSIYTVSSSGGSAPTTQQVALSSGLTLASQELKMTNSSSGATSVTAGMITRTQESVEGSDIQDLNWNATSGGVPVTVSGWLKSSIASADIGVSLKGASTESYVHDCVASGTASTWTFCSFVVPAPPTGTWTISQGNVGLTLNFAYQCGSTFQATANSWTSGTFYCSANQTQVLGTNSATVELAAWKMERGTTPTVFTSLPTGTNMAILRRYLQTSFPLGTAPANNVTYAGSQCFNAASATSAANSTMVQLAPPLYASPSITLYSPGATGTGTFYDFTGSATVTASTDPATAKGTAGFEVATGAGTTAAHVLCIGWLADSGI